MNAQRWEEIQVGFDQLVELDAPHRTARLAMLASSDPELHRALESMLEADAAASARSRSYTRGMSRSRALSSPALHCRNRPVTSDDAGAIPTSGVRNGASP